MEAFLRMHGNVKGVTFERSRWRQVTQRRRWIRQGKEVQRQRKGLQKRRIEMQTRRMVRWRARMLRNRCVKCLDGWRGRAVTEGYSQVHQCKESSWEQGLGVCALYVNSVIFGLNLSSKCHPVWTKRMRQTRTSLTSQRKNRPWQASWRRWGCSIDRLWIKTEEVATEGEHGSPVQTSISPKCGVQSSL